MGEGKWADVGLGDFSLWVSTNTIFQRKTGISWLWSNRNKIYLGGERDYVYLLYIMLVWSPITLLHYVMLTRSFPDKMLAMNLYLHFITYLCLCYHIFIRFQVNSEGLSHLSNPIEDYFNFNNVLGFSLLKLDFYKCKITDLNLLHVNMRSICYVFLTVFPTTRNIFYNVAQCACVCVCVNKME